MHGDLRHPEEFGDTTPFPNQRTRRLQAKTGLGRHLRAADVILWLTIDARWADLY